MSDSDKAEVKKQKNLKRVEAGRKGAEARKRNSELRRKETETIKKENMELKSITKDDEEVKNPPNSQNINIYKNYIPICITIGVVGLGLYMYKSTTNKPIQTYTPPVEIHVQKEKEIDPFEFN